MGDVGPTLTGAGRVGGNELEGWGPRSGMSAVIVADTELQEVGEGNLTIR
jgi:hypothetical protein